MASRTRYLLTYDIRNSRRLRRVHAVARDFGEPLQYSVFVCDLTKVELLDLKSELLEEMNTREDSVAVFDLGAPATRGVQCVEFIGVKRPLPDEAPRVW